MECKRCPYRKICSELPEDMSCEDVRQYANDGKDAVGGLTEKEDGTHEDPD